MTQKEISELADKEKLKEAKKKKSDLITNAFFIGFLIGIVIYSIAVNNWGLVTLLPLFLIYKLIKSSNKEKSNT